MAEGKGRKPLTARGFLEGVKALLTGESRRKIFRSDHVLGLFDELHLERPKEVNVDLFETDDSVQLRLFFAYASGECCGCQADLARSPSGEVEDEALEAELRNLIRARGRPR